MEIKNRKSRTKVKEEWRENIYNAKTGEYFKKYKLNEFLGIKNQKYH